MGAPSHGNEVVQILEGNTVFGHYRPMPACQSLELRQACVACPRLLASLSHPRPV